MKDFKAKTITGISWSLSNQLVTQIVNLVFGVVLARLLSPEDFGLLGMVMAFAAFANIFLDIGLGSAIIQRKQVDQEQLSTIFWINVVSGLLLAIVLFIGSGPLAGFYQNSEIIILAQVLSLNFIITSFGIIQNTLLRKALNFKALFQVSLTSLTLSSVVAIVLALKGFGVWSLVALSLLGNISKVLGYWILSSWRPHLKFNWHNVKDMVGFGLKLLGNSSLNYWARNMDNLLIGKFLGMGQLGLYSKAYSLMMLPLTRITRAIGSVLFPSLALIQEDLHRVKRVYVKIIQSIAWITFPMMLGAFVIADPLIDTLLGEKWLGMIPVFQIFTFTGLAQSIFATTGQIFVSQNRPDIPLKFGLVTKPILFAAIYITAKYGIVEVALAVTGWSLATGILQLWLAGRLIYLRIGEILKSVLPYLASSLVMISLLIILSKFLEGQLAKAYLLIIQIITGVIIYFLISIIFRLKAYSEIKQIVFDRFIQRSV